MPPYLCEQWAKEIEEKFNLDPVVIRAGTIGQLERQTPAGRSLYEHFPFQVASIDFVKTDRNRHHFLQHCPELVIVDEVHGAAESQGTTQQERHRPLKDIAANRHRHLILLTATPHSGIGGTFRSLLGLLDPAFANWDVSQLDNDQRAMLARHFVQRTRADNAHTWQVRGCFPKRELAEVTYQLSGPYRRLFERTYDFCYEIVQSSAQLEKRQRRVRNWAALELLRCVMSSPAAARAALAQRVRGYEADDELESMAILFEPAQDRIDDEVPIAAVETVATRPADSRGQRLQELALLAAQLEDAGADTKLERAIALTQSLLAEGFHPILWCRYVATAEDVADRLQQHLREEVQVVCVTGRIGDEERRAKLAAIDPERPARAGGNRVSLRRHQSAKVVHSCRPL